MLPSRTLPWPGIAIAAATAIAMYAAGADIWLTLAVMLLWIASLWLIRPTEQVIQPQTDSVQLTRDGMRDMIEQFSLPLLLLDRNRVIIANSAARVVFGKHIVGQDARIALRHPQAIALLDRKRGGSATIQGLTTPRSIWKVTRHAINERYWVIELHNRTAEADISRAHTDFVANASHELRTPLASIIGYVETLTEEGLDADPKTSARFLDTVLREAKRLQSLVSDLMSLSRIEAEKHEQPSERIDLAKLVAKAARDAGTPADKVRINVEVPKIEVAARGDTQQLEQLVRNLTDNALKYGDSKKNVDVKLAVEDGDRAVLTVTDRGEGIDPEHIPHLTRRFYRTDPGRSRAAGGTGLGLAIVKHIVERHRGRLDIASKLGEGTIVTIRLPTIDKTP
ncbi:MAG: ATP-binding protein [Candidatus Andeanibacterium colombiense]|uniref:histidine kinase n=1 Tax=Candidatus Andeanibacterium colombiense TaxID=3121345 RepID=A0AAJ5X7I0_9SPHN|nr:MAG: ATP-binding protein [Sphingomonadaceae bacterium]